MRSQEHNSYRIIEDLNERDPPKPHEKRAARVIASYFKSDIKFIRRTINSSPDIEIIKTHERWEIKSPLGGIDNNLRVASDQAKNVFLDLSRCKMGQSEAISRAKNFCLGKWRHRCHLKKLRVITKAGKIIDIIG